MGKRNRPPRQPGTRHPSAAAERGAVPHRRPRPEPAENRQRWPAESVPATGAAYWLYGSHAVRAALANPRRRIERLLLARDSEDGRETLTAAVSNASGPQARPELELAERAEISRQLPDGAVHQGIAALVQPLPTLGIEDICARTAGVDRATVVVLDQVTDPHNVGAILRSSAAFGAAAVVLTDRNAPPETGTLAKSASGALEHVPLVRVTNLARALEHLKEAGFWCAGLAAEGRETLAEARLSGRVALVLGSEGEGLRRLTRERCDLLVRLPTAGAIDHLNVSNAAAVALYELVRDTSRQAATT